MPSVERSGVTLHYEDEGTGYPIVLLQGLGYGRWMWRWQRERLQGDHRIIAPDTRGTGRSEGGLPAPLAHLPDRVARPLLLWRAGHTMETLAADLEAVLADAGVRSAHLIGSSLGAMIGLRYALEHTRVTAMTLCAATPGGDLAEPIPASTQEQLFADPGSPRERIRTRMRPAFTRRFTNRNPHLIDRIIEWRLESDASEAARAAQARAGLGFDVSEDLGRIRVPVQLIHGTADAVVPVENARALEAGIPDAMLDLIEGGSHLVTIEQATAVNDRIESFLELVS